MMLHTIIGVDEAGRGPLAGPVVAAAVVLHKLVPGIKDSKKLSASKRAKLAVSIKQLAEQWSIGMASPAEIDELNIHNATLLAMSRALHGITARATCVLVDGKFAPSSSYLCIPIIKGDNSNYSIAAASILAKDTRDTIMIELSVKYPQYNFSQHKGYPTKEHMVAIDANGPTPVHRLSFSPLSKR